MIWQVEYRGEALADIAATYRWYEKHRGVGAKFSSALISSVCKLRENPFAYRLQGNKRRMHWCPVKRFPYRVVYRVDSDLIKIIAVVHVARHHRTWKNRL